MRLFTIATLCASVSLAAIPAFAQTQDSTGSAPTPNHAQNMQTGMSPRQELMQDLQKAGFTKIKIQPEAFIVHATNSQGEPVLMQITPDSMESVTTIKQGTPNSSGNTASNGSSTGQPGPKTE